MLLAALIVPGIIVVLAAILALSLDPPINVLIR